MMKAGNMQLKKDRPFATPEGAEQKLLELANAIEADHAGQRTFLIEAHETAIPGDIRRRSTRSPVKGGP
jgi:hypothetical protein